MTNYEKIKSMAVEEMAKAICDMSINCQKYCVFVKNSECDNYGDCEVCEKGIEMWLEREAQNEKGEEI